MAAGIRGEPAAPPAARGGPTRPGPPAGSHRLPLTHQASHAPGHQYASRAAALHVRQEGLNRPHRPGHVRVQHRGHGARRVQLERPEQAPARITHYRERGRCAHLTRGPLPRGGPGCSLDLRTSCFGHGAGKAPVHRLRGDSPSTSTRPSVTRARAAATESASLTSNCKVSREPGGHPRARAISHSGPCAVRSRSVAYTGGLGRGRGSDFPAHPCLGPASPGAAPFSPSPSTHVPLKLRDGSDARRRARCRPMPEEQPVMSTMVRSMRRRSRRGWECWALVSGLDIGASPRPALQGPHPLLCLPHNLKARPFCCSLA